MQRQRTTLPAIITSQIARLVLLKKFFIGPQIALPFRGPEVVRAAFYIFIGQVLPGAQIGAVGQTSFGLQPGCGSSCSGAIAKAAPSTTIKKPTKIVFAFMRILRAASSGWHGF